MTPKLDFERDVSAENLRDRDVVVLAESAHGTHDEEISRFLDAHLAEIDGAFFEIPVDYQTSVERFIATGEVDETLEGWFAGAEREGKNVRGILAHIARIAAAGKSVVCIDAAKSPFGEYARKADDGYYFLRGASRDEDMFAAIEQYRAAHPGKYLVIAGASHVMDDTHHRTGVPTLGKQLANRFGDRYASVILQSKEVQD